MSRFSKARKHLRSHGRCLKSERGKLIVRGHEGQGKERRYGVLLEAENLVQVEAFMSK